MTPPAPHSRHAPAGPLAPALPGAGLVGLIGDTPLMDLSFLVDRPPVRLLAKAELTNPGGSVKDRPALAMIQAAEAEGRLGPAGDHRRDRRILDATSGNTGIALAMIGAAKGYGVTLCMPANASRERKALLAAYGAEVILTDPLDGSDGAIRKARELHGQDPDRYCYLDQYANPANWQAHFSTTGPEIWAQTEGRLSHFVTALGTTGTFVGVGRFLRRQSGPVRLISVQPDSPINGLEGLKHLETAIVPEIYDPDLADEEWTVSTEDAYEMVKVLARTAGLAVGVSTGANVATALRLARGLSAGTVVTVLCDGAERYLSESFWEAS